MAGAGSNGVSGYNPQTLTPSRKSKNRNSEKHGEVRLSEKSEEGEGRVDAGKSSSYGDRHCDTRARRRGRGVTPVQEAWCRGHRQGAAPGSFGWKGYMDESDIHRNERDLETV
ncbi:hypothetical protein LR48_Vigan01g264900 [Vigna angularis]|uniref:Uncharacterized protein n=1 Tax=Phaseolus angularis TaxID=3914 RepID=A0A0L9TR84_PHAAN|nr:hypothetical protein LR48_Vigan01g264900 [Vigna angularis]